MTSLELKLIHSLNVSIPLYVYSDPYPCQGCHMRAMYIFPDIKTVNLDRIT